MAKATSLAKAYMSETIPGAGGYLVSALFQSDSAYTIYEITAYANVKDIYKDGSELVFRTDGSRTFILYEPPTYIRKHLEPVHREAGLSIPYRFDEIDVLSGRKREKLMVPREHIHLHSSFTMLAWDSDSFSFIFHPTDDVLPALEKFITDSLYNDCNVARGDAKEASKLVMKTINSFAVFE